MEKDQRLQIRVSKVTMDALTRMADAEAMTVSGAVRDAVNQWMSERTPGHRLPHGHWPLDKNEALELYAERQAELLRQLRETLEIIDAGGLEEFIRQGEEGTAEREPEK